jgi:hypothetical protein
MRRAWHVVIGAVAIAASPLLLAIAGVFMVAFIIWEVLRVIGEGVEEIVIRRSA